MWTYAAKYSDTHGEEGTTVENDGQKLRMVVRGVAFTGTDFDLLEPENLSAPSGLATFTLDHNCLCACVVGVAMEVLVVSGENRCKTAKLLVTLELGNPVPSKGLDNENLGLRLIADDKQYLSSGTSGWFEDEMLDLQRQLPSGDFIKTCINCAYSDYSPVGHGLFGDMMCFRNKKTQYLEVGSKGDFFKLGKPEEYVQETYLCPEFERRKPGTGYRG